MRLTFEKILALKSMPLFENVNQNVLTDVISKAEETLVAAGDDFIKSGENVSALYIVSQGLVRVHKGGKTIAELGPNRYWGLLFAFDPSPTQFTFTAAEDTLLFKLGGDALYEVLVDHKEVAQNLIMTMCRRVKEKDSGTFS